MVTNLRRLSQDEHELALARRRVDIGAPVMTLKPTRSMNAACRRRYGLDARLRSTMQSGEHQNRTAPLHMAYLWTFGDNVEDNFSQLRFLVFYIIAGISRCSHKRPTFRTPHCRI